MKQWASAGWPTTPELLLADLGDHCNSVAWDRFERTYGAILKVFCVRRGLQEADAEDVSQKVLLDVSRQIGAFRLQPERGRFRSWLATIANRAVWRLRRRRASTGEIRLEDLSAQEHPADNGWMFDFNEAVLDTALDSIRDDFTVEEWTAFEQNWKLDVASPEVATMLNRPISWVYQTKFKVLQRLRQEIEALSANIICPDS